MWRSGTVPNANWPRRRRRTCPPMRPSSAARPRSQGLRVRRLAEPQSRQAVAAYEQAIALDSSFIQAWAQLARAEAALYLGGAADPARAEAVRRAAERALALAPTRPEGHQALGAYYSYVLADKARALCPGQHAPRSGTGQCRAAQGCGVRRAHARPLGGGARAPGAGCPARSPLRHNRRSAGAAVAYTRHYPEAERALDHALQLLPANLIVARGSGDGGGGAGRPRAGAGHHQRSAQGGGPHGARRVRGRTTGTSAGCWTTPSSSCCCGSRRARSTTTAAHGPSCCAQTYALRGDTAKARVYADSARAGLSRSS